MKRDTGTKVYPTDADATKKKQTSYNHITSSLMRSSKVQASEEERDITKKHRVLKIRERYKESRQLDALHFYTVPEGRDG